LVQEYCIYLSEFLEENTI